MANAVRQSQTPMMYTNTLRSENLNLRTSAKAARVACVSAFPLFRGDSASGRVTLNLALAEMPKPLENIVLARAQAWFVPRPSLPQFEGLDEYTAAYHGKQVTRLGAAARDPAPLFDTISTGGAAGANQGEFFKTCGLPIQPSTATNTDYVDAYIHVQNFRLASYTSKDARYEYYQEDSADAMKLKPAFWPRNRFHDVVPDYELALSTGELELDVAAGMIPVDGIWMAGIGGTSASGVADLKQTDGTILNPGTTDEKGLNANFFASTRLVDSVRFPEIYADMAGQQIQTTLADIDKARTTQAFAKAMAAMAGNDFSGFNNDDVLVAELMQGFRPPDELYNRPWLLDDRTVIFGMQERHATDAANLDDSVTTGMASTTLSINIPRTEYGGIVIVTVEVMPERLYERASDEYMYVLDVDDLPNALRDLQRTNPVDTVLNRRLDTEHTAPNGTYGFEPMNRKWNRDFTRLGGEFRQFTPGTPSTVARTAVWQVDYVDPAFTRDHYVCEYPFPQDVFSIPANDIVNISTIQTVTISGLTQFGDALVEDNDEFELVAAEVEGV